MIRQEQRSEWDGDRALLRPVTLGDLRLPNRVVMAPVTRCRATNDDLAPTDLHAAYYGQRAGAGLIIAEGTWTSERTIGFYPNVPGVYSERQVAAWSRVTHVVHALGGRIVLQLWHAGDPRSDREMTVADIERTIADFGAASENARRAGFDGVEIAANGTHLIARFLNPRLNRRADGHGTRRDRLLFEIVEAAAAAWEGRRLGVRLSPYWTIDDEPSADRRGGDYPWNADERTLADYDALVAELNERPLAYLHLRGPAPRGPVPDVDAFARYRKLFDGPLIANHGFDGETGDAIVEAGIADAVSFARLFIANPDLVGRFALGHETAGSDPDTHYSGGARGYVDYPTWPLGVSAMRSM
ncbi:alkene reductase [Actinoallomurus vinaceus]|uniref:Alkene reductase n=1 Tax=Actinoallomurus vinaceus TaxID=1080074 RepID=A0ABP8UT21_9ACTN